MRVSGRALSLAVIALAWVGIDAAQAEAPRLALPVDCAMPDVCFIQQYVDTQPEAGAQDYRCGPLSYDDHGGTDFRVRTMAEMEAGVPVIAAAPGVVKGLRDGMADVNVGKIGREALGGRDAGNGVVIDHGNGWETQYSHLKRGSLRVRQGQRVERGTLLGEIGLSGNTEFPHVDFAVRHNGVTLDPFTGRAEATGCGQGESLWDPKLDEALAYVPGGALFDGFLDRPPELDAAVDGAYRDAQPGRAAPALVYYGLAWGLQGGDREEIVLIGPDGRILAQGESEIERDKARWMRFAGRHQPAEGWPAGSYQGRYRVWRGDKLVVDMRRTLTLD